MKFIVLSIKQSNVNWNLNLWIRIKNVAFWIYLFAYNLVDII